MTTSGTARIEGNVTEGFEPVREAFVANFTTRGETGGACCVYLDGESVVDLWGGVRDVATRAPWQARTMVIVHSATKGLAALGLALAHSRGLLDYDERVAAYWPEFAQAGKDAITVRQLLAHQAGLFAFDEQVDRDVVADPDRSRHRSSWTSGSALPTRWTKTSWRPSSLPGCGPSSPRCPWPSPGSRSAGNRFCTGPSWPTPAPPST
jgi:CubicO group peptidase (beta-lactamase class C family)